MLKQHDYGLTLGGPVRIPWIYNGKNKTFFFGSAEWFRNRAGANSFVTSVPTPEMYQGDFSKWVDSNGKTAADLRPGDHAPESEFQSRPGDQRIEPTIHSRPFPE